MLYIGYHALITPLSSVFVFCPDWLLHPQASNTWLSDALHLLQTAPEQTCLTVPKDADNCRGPIPMLGQVLLDARHGGWPRVHNGIGYLYHEFGLVENEYHTPIENGGFPSVAGHDLANWPGFSNHPGVWDMEVFRSAGLRFNPGDGLFEQTFSTLFFDAGLRVASLVHEREQESSEELWTRGDLTRHLGDDTSAYILNSQLPRYWD